MTNGAGRKKRRVRRRMLAAAAGVATVGGVGIAIGPGAPWVVEHLADGQRVWRLGNLQIEGVSGGWLGDLRAAQVRIADADGVWLSAENVDLNWRPLDLIFGTLRIDAAAADRVSVLRQPVLSEPRPSSGASFDIRIGGLDVELLQIAEATYGQAAEFTLHLGLDLRDRQLEGLAVELRRTDSDADRVSIAYEPDEDYTLEVDVEGAPGGILSRALGYPEDGVRATAAGRGDPQTGEADYQAAIGARQILAGTARWTPANWQAQGEAQLDALAQTANLARRIGPSVAFDASGARVGAFNLHAETPFLALDIEGELNARRELVEAARFTATTQRISDIARESPFELGAARLVGELRRARNVTAIQAVLSAERVDALGQTTSFSGPLHASLSGRRFVLVADLQTPDDAPALFAGARLRTELAYDRTRGRFALERASLVSDAISIDAQGWVRGGGGAFAGDWRIRRLGAFSPDLAGQASGRWRAYAEAGDSARVWTATLIGTGANIGGEPVVPQLVGASPRLDALFRYEDGGITVAHARLDSTQLRAAASGRIVSGQADLALEASARGPLTIGAAQISGAVDATGRLRGRIARPTLAATAAFSSFSAGGAVVEQPNVEFTLASAARGYAGRARVTGVFSDQPLDAATDVAIADSALELTGIDGTLGGLSGRGEAAFTPRGASANIAFEGVLDGLAPGLSGRANGAVALTPQQLVLDAQLDNARSGELWVRAASLHAEGPFDAIAARFTLNGRLRRAPLTFAGTGALDLEGDAALSIEGRGTLAGADVFTRAPMRATWSDGGVEASLNVALGDGVVAVAWRDRGRSLSGTAEINDAPLGPLAAIWGERADGRIDGRLTLASSGRGLTGSADVTLEDARFAGRQRGLLDMRIVGELSPNRLQASVDARSTDGLIARFEANAPVVTSLTPIRIALAPERRGEATWRVSGPAESLWAAARLQDQSLEGQLEGEGELSFGAGYLSGDGYIEIADGRFEDKLTGVTLLDLDARIAIGDRGVSIETFTATGPGGGRLTATGGSANQREGRIAVTVENMRVADRPDARARASGNLTLEWEGMDSSLTGALNIIEAEIDIAANPEAGIPTLDVIEINRPGYEDEPQDDDDEAPRRNGATRLDIEVNAPGRVFTRGRGVEAEWSLDLDLRGTAQNPLVYGTARTVRGTLALSGQPFDIEAATIVFDGDPLDARIDMTARRDTADMTARIHLIGTARAPEVTLSSDPPLPEDEILPQVLFGSSVEDLSALEAAQLAASLAALSGRSSLDLVDAARAAAGLDRFNVRQDEAGGFLVAGGVYLTRDVYVEVARTGLGQAQTRVEWTVRPRLVLITSFLTNGDQRVSLRWRRESD